jgi:hypothetical protein
MRAIIIRRAWHIQEDHIEQQMESSMDRNTAEEDVPVIHQLVQRDVAKFITITEFGS